jgi:filamentous hemagglutinin family protein
VVQGAVQFNQNAQQLNILQGSDRAAVNWQSFDIGAAAKVNVVQPSAQSVLLNRVGGEAPSQIFGQLQANGQVILVNPNGMVFGKDGSVSAAGFTGSTLNISDADFMAGKERYTRSGTAAATSAIVNRGLIQAAPGGYVALLGASVSNEGRIEAPQGNVFMAAADAVTLPSPTVGLPIGPSGRIRLELTPASISAAVANHKGGTIVTEGGQVYLQAAAVNAALARIIQSGSIDTTGVQGGQVHVLADGGHIRVDGQIKTNSTDGSAGGDIYIGRDKDTNVLAAVGDVRGAQLTSKGGFVETSGTHLKTDGISVSAKDWLLDPSDITISNSASSNVTGTSPDDITPNGGAGTGSLTMSYLAVASLVVFIIGFAMSAGPIIWILCAEIFPLAGRDFGITCSTVTNWAANAVVGMTFLTMLNLLGPGNTFILYGALNAVFMIFFLALVPETKGVSLESIEKKLLNYSRVAQRRLDDFRSNY